MISVCTVILGRMEEYVQVLSHSLAKWSQHVKEVIFIKIDSLHVGPKRQWRDNGIDFKILDRPLDHSQWSHDSMLMVAGHALGLHHGIDEAQEKYVWLTDPDVFFFTSVDDLYLRLMREHNLGIIGISHFAPQQQSYLDFPCVTNCMIRRDALPPNDWQSEALSLQSGMRLVENCRRLASMPGKYLIPGPIEPEAFPNPNGMFDVGCNLWLWAKQNNWRWLSFYLDAGQFPHNNTEYGFKELVYPMNYDVGHYRCNFGLQVKLEHEDLLYHRTMAVGQSGADYLNLYQSLIPNNVSSLPHKIP